MLRNILVLLIGLYFSAPALSASDSTTRIKDIYFNLGTHTEFFNAVQVDDSGSMRKFDFAPTIGAGLTIPFAESWYYLPEFNWVLPQMEENSHIMINTFMYRFDVGYDPLEWLRLRLGTGIIHQNQQGRGGKTTKRNGNDYSTFYYPDDNQSSLNNTLDIGVEALYEQYAIRLQTYTYSVFREDRRQLSYTIFLTYYWKQ